MAYTWGVNLSSNDDPPSAPPNLHVFTLLQWSRKATGTNAFGRKHG